MQATLQIRQTNDKDVQVKVALFSPSNSDPLGKEASKKQRERQSSERWVLTP